MGFFSWMTDDTHDSIANIHQEVVKPFTVYMKNYSTVWKEPAYDGYGKFGGKDIYLLLGEMNNLDLSRDGVIELCSSGFFTQSKRKRGEIVFPMLHRYENSTAVGQFINCFEQGYFYYE